MYIDPLELENIQWEPTSYCNANCIGCPRTDPETLLTTALIHKWQRHAPYKPFLKSINPKLLPNLKWITFNGNIGDAMMHPDIDKIIIESLMRNQNIHITIHTNGGGLHSKKWENIGKFINDNNLQHRILIIFSVDGLEDTNHLYRRNVQWKNINNNRKTLKKYNMYGTWRFIKFDHNKHQIDDARKLAEKWGWKFKLNFPYNENRIKRLLHTPNNPKLFKEKLKEWNNDNSDVTVSIKNERNNFSKKESELTPIPNQNTKCPWQEEKTIQLLSDYTVWPCCWTGHMNVMYRTKPNTKKYQPNHMLFETAEWEKIINENNDTLWYDRNDIRVTETQTLSDILTGDGFNRINEILTTPINNRFQLDLCQKTCAETHTFKHESEVAVRYGEYPKGQ